MRAHSRGLWAGLLLLLSAFHMGCEYVRPTLNAPLDKWVPDGGYRFTNVAPPESDNTDSLLFVAAFSGGGTRASTLAFGALRELAHQQIVWEGKQKRLLDELDLIHGEFALNDGKLISKSERGTVEASLYEAGGQRLLKAKGRAADGTEYTAEVKPAK